MSKPWNDWKALIVGFGSAGCRHLRILRELGFEHFSVCDPDEEPRAKARSEYRTGEVFSSLEQALETGPRVVFICSPTAEHAAQAMQCLASGSDVFIEKPRSATLESIDRLAALAEGTDRTVMVGHCFRFHEGLCKAKEWLDAGRIGRLAAVRASMGEYIPDVMPNYRHMYIVQYSGAYELIHDVDLALWYAGRRPLKVFGLEGTLGDTEMESPDFVEILMEFPERCAASVHLDFFQRARRRQTELLGTEGTIIVEFARWDECGLSIYEAGSREWKHERFATDRDDMFRDEDRAFLEAVASGTPVPIDIEEGRLPVEVTAAAQESARTGRAIELQKPESRRAKRGAKSRTVSSA